MLRLSSLVASLSSLSCNHSSSPDFIYTRPHCDTTPIVTFPLFLAIGKGQLSVQLGLASKYMTDTYKTSCSFVFT